MGAGMRLSGLAVWTLAVMAGATTARRSGSSTPVTITTRPGMTFLTPWGRILSPKPRATATSRASAALPISRRHGPADDDFPASCGYEYPRMYSCERNALRTAPGRAAFSNDTVSINLSSNKLTAIPPTTFEGLVALSVLRLDSNELTAIKTATLGGLIALSQLVLSSNKISVLEPTTLASLTALTSLNLDSNAIAVIEPTTLMNNVALGMLLLHSNKLTAIAPTLFGRGGRGSLPALEMLSLHSNLLTEIDKSTFSNLTKLAYLYLNSNQLTGLEPTTFSHLCALSELDLSSNKLAVLEPATFATLTSLTVLRLDSNQLTVIEPDTFADLTVLTQLYLSSNQLTVIEPETFSDLTALTRLDLDSNQLTAIEPETFADLTALTYLDLDSNQLTFIRPETFADLTALTYLDLDSNQLTAIEPNTFADLTALTYLDLDSNQLTAIEPTTFSNLTALTELDLHSNKLTTLDATTFFGLTALTRLDLGSNVLTMLTFLRGVVALTQLNLASNQLTVIEPVAFSALTALTMLDLHSNALTVLQNSTFAALLNLDYLNLAANRIHTLDDGVFDFAAMYVRLNGSGLDHIPHLLYNPNPLQCGNSSAGSAVWGGAEPLRCSLCTQGHVQSNTSADSPRHRRHVSCARPHFGLDVEAGTQALGTLRNGLNGRIAYIGEELDVYQQATTTGGRTFEPKRDKFRGYAPEKNSFSAIRFETKVGNIDIGCGAVVVGSLHGPRSVASRIHQEWQPGGTEEHHDLDPVPLCTGRQRLLRFQVLNDGIFDFTSCGSRYPASLGVYNASCNGTDGSLVDCIVVPYTLEQDPEFNQIGHDAPDAPPLHLPDRYSCPIGPSANLSNVYLSAGRYLLGVQPLPRAPTPESPNDVFEVEMRCRDTATAAPLDPTDGGVTANPVTGQLTISPGKNAMPGNYSLELTAVDAAGARTTLLQQTLPIRRRSKLAFTASCGGEVHRASATNIHGKNNENGPSRRHDLGSVVVFPAFLIGPGSDDDCRAGNTFANFASDANGDPLIRYDVVITTAAGNNTDLGQDTFVNGRTGKLAFTLEPYLGAGNYSVSLRASTGDEGAPLTLQSWVMDVRHGDTKTAINGPNSRGCGANGTPEDTRPQDDAYTCQCDHRFEGDNCETPVADTATNAAADSTADTATNAAADNPTPHPATNSTTESTTTTNAAADSTTETATYPASTTILGGAIGSIALVLLAGLTAVRYKLNAKNRPVDVGAIQAAILQQLGLALPTDMGPNDFGVTLTIDDVDADDPGDSPEEVGPRAPTAPRHALRRINVVRRAVQATRARSILTRPWTGNSLSYPMLNPDELELQPMMATTTSNAGFDVGDTMGSGAPVAATRARPAGTSPEQDDLVQSMRFRHGLGAALTKIIPGLASSMQQARMSTLSSSTLGRSDVLVVMPRGRHHQQDDHAVAAALSAAASKRQLVIGTHVVSAVCLAMPRQIPREIDRKDVRRIALLGEGLAAEVHTYELSEPHRGALPFLVAAKTVKATNDVSVTRNKLLSEAAMLALLSHRNVLPLVGVVTVPRDLPALVLLMYCERGSLKDHVLAAGVGGISTATLLTFCAEVLQGLHYISSRRIVHRDVAARNVLLDANEVCKLADFGRAVTVADASNGYAPLSEELRIRHAAVEVLESGRFSTASDVWSFGCLAWEVFAAGTDPYHNIASVADVSSYVRAGKRMSGPRGQPVEIHQSVMAPCWEASPADRPGILDLYNSVVSVGATPDGLARDEMQPAFWARS